MRIEAHRIEVGFGRIVSRDINGRSMEMRHVHSAILAGIKASGVVEAFAGRRIDDGMLVEVGAFLTKALRHHTVAFHETVLVPASDGMIRARITQPTGQVWTVTVLRLPQESAS